MKITKRIICVILTLALLLAAVPGVFAGQTTESLPADLSDSSAWYYDSAAYCYEYGYMVGDDQGNFNPMNNITRAEIATILARILYAGYESLDDAGFRALLNSVYAGEPLDPFEAPPVVPDDDLPYFADADGKWYERGVLLLAADNILSGCGDGTFAGERNITRQELAVILQSVVGNSISFGGGREFPDLNDAADWARDAVAWAGACGLFSGNGEGRFLPLSNATRAEIAVLITTVVGSMIP